ncbi:MAG: nuclear transport factor 2 family protein [Paucibacter sp.]|nr:nuclear transport factor 2 family protein [Roseateles sp.]
MKHRIHWMIAATLALAGFTRDALADDQQDVWRLEQQQWKLAAAKDNSWIDTMVHPNLRMWETGAPMPRDRASLQHWARYENANGTMLEYELLPVSTTITGNVAVVQYYYMMARENYKKERETVTGHYTDVLMKEGGKWLFIAWSGGDDPKK